MTEMYSDNAYSLQALMQLRLFNYSERHLLDPALDEDGKGYHDAIKTLGRSIFNDFLWKDSFDVESVDIPELELEAIASWYCDTWILNVERHMSSYMKAMQAPTLRESVIPEAVLDPHPLIKHKNFSGDASGVIGEALFAFLLIRRFGVDSGQFTHFRASKATGIYPDFGIHQVSTDLQTAFEEYCSLEPGWLVHQDLIPAEVKAMTSPDMRIINDRLSKAVQQIRSFWRRRHQEIPTHRGPGIVFLALRNPRRSAYDGAVIWLS